MHKLKLDETQSTEKKQNPAEEIEAKDAQQTELDVETQASDNNGSSVDIKNEIGNRQTLEKKTMKKATLKISLIIALIAAVSGIATGYGGYKLNLKSGSDSKSPANSKLERVATENQIKAGDTFGVEDEKTFSDQAQGYLEDGGLNGEGSHKLIRAGGESQTVYLTSSITDLDKFIGMEVKIWGETFKGQKAGWLMDVGRIEVLKTDGQAPTEN